MDQVPPPPPVAPPEPAKKKGMHPMAWVGIGCGGLLVLAVIGIAFGIGAFKRKVNELKQDMDEFQQEFASNPEKTAAEMVVRMNPDLEMVLDDETAGEMTLRVKSTGEEITVSYADLVEGRLTITGPDGTKTTLGTSDNSQIPDWVPRYPNIAEQMSLFHEEGADGILGVWIFSTADTPEQVESYFDSEVDWSNSSSGSTTSMGSATHSERTLSGNGRELTISAVSPGSGQATQITLSYRESQP